MPKNKGIGEKGEAIAADFLIKEGYQILAKNYRFLRNEIDIVAKKGDLLIFVEVKMRKNNLFGFPESFVSDAQSKRIKIASEQYQLEIGWHGAIRFDILALTGKETSTVLISHFEDAF